MNKVIMCKGLPASGKSTYAKELILKNNGAYKRINKDDLRSMLDVGEFSKPNEKFIIKTRDWLVIESLKKGKSVVVDDTNLATKHEVNLRELVRKFCKEHDQEVTFEVKFFDTPIDECIKRDLSRPHSVGEKVIMRMYQDHLMVKEVDSEISIQQDESLPKAIICDLDGTLSLMNGRNPYDGARCEEDLLNKPVAKLIKRYKEINMSIILLSGRQDTFKQQTLNWLEKHNIEYDRLIMRNGADNRKDAIVKKEFYDEEIKNKYFIEFVLDDRNQVVDMWRKELGLTCLQVNYGDF